MTTPRPKAAPMMVQIFASERPKSLTLPGRGAASWEEALAPCKLPELTETQLEEMRKAIRHLSYLQNSVPKTAQNYEILLGAFSSALWGLFEKHPMGFRTPSTISFGAVGNGLGCLRSNPILARRKGEFEAFTSDERSLGLFRSQVEAADAIHASDTKEQAR